MRSFLPHAVLIVVSMSVAGMAHAASSSPIEVRSIAIDPEAPAVGQQPVITARIARSRDRLPKEPLLFNVVAVVTLPDNITRSSVWKNESLDRRGSKDFVLSYLFDISQAGRYKVEFNVYSPDMRRRLARSVKDFLVGEKAPETPGRKAREAERKAVPKGPERGRDIFGVGIYGNALNPSGGGTVMLWPHDNVGLQGSYTVGTFTFAEARLLVRFGDLAGVRPYVGVGYVSAAREADVIGVTTEFKDSGISGTVGAEIPFSRRVFGYAEVSGTAIDLKKVVTNGSQTVIATVEYAPVTVAAGIIFYLF